MKNGMKQSDVAKLKIYLDNIAKDITPAPDAGTCLLGEGIAVDYLPPRCRLSRRETIYRQPWTQGSQYDALMVMIDKARTMYPELAQWIHYAPGYMD